jgi:hypothetical protein
VTGAADVKTPHFLNYSGNLIVNAGRGSVVPYATAGLGGLSLFERAEVGVNDTTTFLTTNVGGGVKWYAGRWGLRGDYRFIAVQSKDDAPAFLRAGDAIRTPHLRRRHSQRRALTRTTVKAHFPNAECSMHNGVVLHVYSVHSYDAGRRRQDGDGNEIVSETRAMDPRRVRGDAGSPSHHA